ncbi:hypothetical protein K8I28_16925, partial [bacterium]|nr:hypothetical protein [bacterium]
RHDFTAVAIYELTDKWEMSVSWLFHTGQGFTQPLGIYTTRYAFLPPEFSPDDGRTFLPGTRNNYRFPLDHRLDITFTYQHRFFSLPARVNISIYNAYNRRSYWQRNINTNENPAEISDLKLLPIVPLLSYEVHF